MSEKICIKCQLTKDLKLFVRDERHADGFKNICKDCRSLWWKINASKKGKRVHVNRRNDKLGFKTCNDCKIQKSHKCFYKSTYTKDKLIGKCRTCWNKHKKYLNPSVEKIARGLVIGYTRIDLKKGQICDLTEEYLLKNIINKPCYYCRDTLEKRGCDRIDNSKGHTINNVLPCCNTCNSIRSNKFTVSEMLQLGEVVKSIKIKNNNYNG